MDITDNGPQPNAFDIETATTENTQYRVAAWSGKYLQVTLMAIPVGESIGLEAHPDTDQFLRLDPGLLRGRDRAFAYRPRRQLVCAASLRRYW